MTSPGNYKPTKKIPTFNRPSISIGGGETKKREWKPVTALDVREGNIVAGLGLVHKVKYENIDDPANLIVALTVGDPDSIPIKFEAGVLLKAFV